MLLLLLALLPAWARLVAVEVSASMGITGRRNIRDSLKGTSGAGHAQCVGSRGGGNTNGIRVILSAALNAISGRQESVETLNQGWVTIEKSRNPLNHTRGIDCLALEILHDVQEAVVHVRLVDEANLHLIKIAKRIIQNRLLALSQSSNVSRNLLSGGVVAHHGLSRGSTWVLHVGAGSSFAVRHLTEQACGRLRSTLVAVLGSSAQGREEAAGPVDGVGDFVGDGLVERDGAGVALDWVVRLVTALELALDLFAMLALALTVSHLFVALALDDFALSRVPFALAVELGRRVRHGLPDAGEGVAGVVGWACGVLAVGLRLVLTTVGLAQFRQSGEGVTAGLA